MLSVRGIRHVDLDNLGDVQVEPDARQEYADTYNRQADLAEKIEGNLLDYAQAMPGDSRENVMKLGSYVSTLLLNTFLGLEPLGADCVCSSPTKEGSVRQSPDL